MINPRSYTNFIYPISANPLHWGHLAIANYLEKKYDKEVIFTISSTNCDKGKIKKKIIRKRLEQFQDLDRAYFACKYGKFVNISICNNIIDNRYPKNNIQFTGPCIKRYPLVMGSDTWNRFVDPKYYFDSEEERNRIVNKTLRRQNIHIFNRDGHVVNIQFLDKNYVNILSISQDFFDRY